MFLQSLLFTRHQKKVQFLAMILKIWHIFSTKFNTIFDRLYTVGKKQRIHGNEFT